LHVACDTGLQVARVPVFPANTFAVVSAAEVEAEAGTVYASGVLVFHEKTPNNSDKLLQ